MPGATIYDVSKRAGVSIATVSRVLNKPETVTMETRERVLVAIDELGFIPKFEAITRARKELGRIGVLTPSIVDSIVERMRGITEALSELPYETAIYNANSSSQVTGYLTNMALTRVVDGLIVIGIPFDEATGQRLLASQLPVVLLGDKYISFFSGFNNILIDHGAGGSMAARYLLAQGHRRLGFIGDAYLPNLGDAIGNSKLDFFRQTLAEAGVALPDSYVGLTRLDMEHARQKAQRLLTLSQPPTAIFAASDNQAIAVMSAARELGMSIPDDLAVMGFDDIAIAEYIGLTTIRQPLKASGRLAVEMLLGQIEDSSQPVKRIDQELTLVQRISA